MSSLRRDPKCCSRLHFSIYALSWSPLQKSCALFATKSLITAWTTVATEVVSSFSKFSTLVVVCWHDSCFGTDGASRKLDPMVTYLVDGYGVGGLGGGWSRLSSYRLRTTVCLRGHSRCLCSLTKSARRTMFFTLAFVCHARNLCTK